MESYLVVSLLFLGGLVGAGSVWLYWQSKLRKSEAQFQEAAEKAEQSIKQLTEIKGQLEEEIFTGEQQVERLDVELAAANKQLADIAEELKVSHRQFRKMTEQLQESDQKLHQSEMELGRIPALESSLGQKELELAGLRAEISQLAASITALKEDLVEEKRSLDECIIFVEGSHYLPGKVVRNLIGVNQL